MNEVFKNRDRLTKRAIIYPTLRCNLRCKWCYYFEKLKSDELAHVPVPHMVNKVSLAKNYYGLSTIEITGGEPTIYPDIDRLLQYCHTQDLDTCMITNGLMSKKVGELIDNGLKDVLLSVHGYRDVHNKMIDYKGFDKVKNTIEEMAKRDFLYRVNTVITKINYSNLKEMVDFLLNTYPPRILNLIIFNPHVSVDWARKDMVPFQASYSEIAQPLKDIIDYVESKSDMWVNVRYYPLCFMVGYESHVCNFHQLHYDPYEWAYEFSVGHKAELVQTIIESDKDWYGKGLEKYYNYVVREKLIRTNVFLECCKRCANVNICDGIYSQYIRNFGSDEFSPLKMDGLEITNPMTWREGKREQFSR